VKGSVIASIGVVLICGTTGGCFLRKQPQVTQAPPLPAPAESQKPAAARKTHARRTTSAQGGRTLPNSAAEVPPVPPPSASPESASRLGEILTPQEIQNLTRGLNQSLSSARNSIALASKRPLTAREKQTVKLVLAFASQAEQARQTDLSLAAQLARRAEVLANSLNNPSQ
jgi:hypothetical protein